MAESALYSLDTLPTRSASCILAAIRIAGFALVSVPCGLICGALNGLGVDASFARRFYHRLVCKILGVRVVVRGRQSTATPQLLVANHISYFDIFVLGSAAKGVFVAKAEIADWPFFGIMGKSGRTVFVERKRTATGTARDDIQDRLDAGETLFMFPEATSNDGNYVRAFKSALFAVAEKHAADGRPVTVQPTSIAYTRLNGLPLGIGWRPFFAWYGDMDLVPHVWTALKMGTLTAEVTFHPPVTIADFRNRKALAAHCEKVVSDGVARLLMGRETA